MMKKRNGRFEREIRLMSPWTCKVPTPPPDKNYGRGSMGIYFCLHGGKGCISLFVLTQQYAKADEEMVGHYGSMAGGIHAHAYKKKFLKGRKYILKRDECSILGGCKCYSVECTGMSFAQELWYRFIDNDEPKDLGEDVIWEELEVIYREVFGDELL